MNHCGHSDSNEKNRPGVTALIVAAGSGKRFYESRSSPFNVPKPLILLGGKPIFTYALEALNQISSINAFVVVFHPHFYKPFSESIDSLKVSKPVKLVPGKENRQASVYAGLQHIPASDTVLVHDGVRPFPPGEMIEALIKSVTMDGFLAASPAIAATDTMAEVKDGQIVRVPDRNALYHLQTPQAFQVSVLKNAHELAKNNMLSATDDTSLVLACGVYIHFVSGSRQNLKITTIEDLWLAEQMLAHRP